MITRNILLLGTAVLLAACGGGTGTHIASTPTPPPAPPPPQAANAVNIFPNPVPETYVSVGVGPNRSTADADQPHIRYTAAGTYEIQMPGATYDELVTLKGFVPQDPATNNQFHPASVPQNQAYFFTSNSRLSGYRYSEMAKWATNTVGGGYVAFGSATPTVAMPITGSGSYNGIVEGISDLLETYDIGQIAVGVKGTVALSFNFGAGTLGGSMTLKTDPSNIPVVDLGTFTFNDAVYSIGSATYSGAFNSTGTGSNFFLGRFTGPNAEETIGAWALPIVLSGENHQAVGAWIAKKGP